MPIPTGAFLFSSPPATATVDVSQDSYFLLDVLARLDLSRNVSIGANATGLLDKTSPGTSGSSAREGVDRRVECSAICADVSEASSYSCGGSPDPLRHRAGRGGVAYVETLHCTSSLAVANGLIRPRHGACVVAIMSVRYNRLS